MNSKDRTLVALENYIDSQRTFLEQTNEDIARLRELRQRVLDDPLSVAENLSIELDNDAFRLSRSSVLLNSARQLPSLIKWEILQSKDPDPLKLTNIRTDWRKTSPPRTPNDLQKYVHESANNLLSKLDPLSPSPTPPPCSSPNIKRPLSPLSASLDTRNIKTTAPSESGLRRTSRVHKPKYNKETPEEPTPTLKKQKRKLPVQRARSSSTRSTRRTISPTISRASQAPSETAVGSSQTVGSTVKLKIRIPPLRFPHQPPPEECPGEPPNSEASFRRRGDATSETFNQPWTIEEQHLLEKLLIEIPKGEKNRWARISKGMGGRRSARQVASRVQKYFEKLDRAGIMHPG